MAALIGALRVSLGLDTAAFSDGLKQANSQIASAGKSLQAAGRTLTARVTAPLVAAAGAIGVGVGRMAGSLSELGNQARIANAGVEEFQRLAYAAKTVGIENEKLADILKDVNDKVGDFLSTGGGEMQSFFETIAPKVGVTAEQFARLSGPEALQLYVSSLEKAGLSQAQMTFYLEAIADEATALVPLLANGGAEYQRLGEQAARFGLITAENVESGRQFQEAMRGLAAATTALGVAFVESGVLDILTNIITKVTEWVSVLNSANPQLTQFALIAGGLAAALGPVLVALGALALAISAIGLPIAAVIAGVVALTAAVVAFWPEIKAAGDAAREFASGALRAVSDGIDLMRAKFVEMDEFLAGLRDRFIQIGRDMMDGLLAGLKERWEAVKAWFAELGDAIPQWVRRKLGIESPSTVFAEIGMNITDGLRLGLDQGRPMVAAGVDGMIAEFDRVGGVGQTVGAGLGDLFAGIVSGSKSARESIADLAGELARMYAGKAFQALGQAMPGGGGGFLGALVGGLGGLIGFANGGSFKVGGVGGVDSQMVAFRATPDERVTITRPGQEMMGGELRVHVTASELFNVMVQREADASIARAAPSIVGTAVQRANAQAPAVMARYRRDVAGGDYRG